MTAADFDPLRLGLSPLALEDWLRPQPGDADLLDLRRRLVTDQSHAVLALTEAGAAAVGELCDLLRERGFPLPDGAPADLLGLLAVTVAEDLLLLQPDAAGRFVLAAGVLCFPNRWRLADKIGRGLTEVHGPVPNYESALAGPVDRFLARLRMERAFVRRNWGLASSPSLFLPDPVAPVDVSAAGGFFLREEEQSFVKLMSGAVVFGIRTTVTPWEQVADPVRTGIRAAAAALSPAWRAYKSLK